jgi:hypothetical protein
MTRPGNGQPGFLDRHLKGTTMKHSVYSVKTEKGIYENHVNVTTTTTTAAAAKCCEKLRNMK